MARKGCQLLAADFRGWGNYFSVVKRAQDNANI